MWHLLVRVGRVVVFPLMSVLGLRGSSLAGSVRCSVPPLPSIPCCPLCPIPLCRPSCSVELLDVLHCMCVEFGFDSLDLLFGELCHGAA